MFNSNLKLKVFSHVILFATLICALSCDKDTTKDSKSSPAAQPTEIGKSIGDPTVKTIGPSGGEIASSDQTFTFQIPPGVLAGEQSVKLQAVENTAPNGIRTSFVFNGLPIEVSQPIILIYKPQPGEINPQSANNIALAVQQTNGSWQLEGRVSYDLTTGTLRARIKRVGSKAIAFIEKYSLAPEKVTLIQGQLLKFVIKELDVTMPDADNVEDDIFVPLGKIAERAVISRILLNGLQVDPSYGSVSYPSNTDASFTYTAPTKVPVKSKNPVSVMVELMNPFDKSFLALVSNVTVKTGGELNIDGKKYDDPVVYAFKNNGSFSVEVAEKFREPSGNYAPTVFASFNSYKGSGTYILDEKNISAYSVLAAKGGKSGYHNSYWENNHKTITPITAKISEEAIDENNLVLKGTIEGMFYEDGNKDSGIKVHASFEVISDLSMK